MHIPMRLNLRQYLAFSYQGQRYFYQVLLFSLNVATFIFTKVLAWPLQCFRAKAISLLAYLDDIVVWHRDKDVLQAQMQVMCFLQDMGFRLNLAKSHTYHSLSVVWLGVEWLHQLIGSLASPDGRPGDRPPHDPGVIPCSKSRPLSTRAVGGHDLLCRRASCF